MVDVSHLPLSNIYTFFRRTIMSFVIAVLVGLVGMIACMFYVGDLYGIERKKMAISAVCMVLAGIVSSYIMAFVESGHWGGRSFYGGVFLVPLFMYFVAKYLKIRYGELMDACAPAASFLLSAMKIQCLSDGCCYGRLFMTTQYAFRFPSQIVECLFAFILMIVMLAIIKKGDQRNLVCAWWLVIYGAGRFILNLLRETTPWIGPLPAGNVWSLLAIIIGIIVLVVNKRKVQPKPVN